MSRTTSMPGFTQAPITLAEKLTLILDSTLNLTKSLNRVFNEGQGHLVLAHA